MFRSSSWRLLVPALVAMLLIAFTFVLATANGPDIARNTQETGVLPQSPTGVLYDQTSNSAGNGAPDQDFETSFDAYDSEGADDFVVPAGTMWSVDGVNIVGTTGGNSASVDVAFYADNATFPAAAPTCSYPGLTTFTGSGSLSITLPTTCDLGEGNWWVAIQVNQDYGTSGQHFWSNRSVQSNNGAVWRNPGDGFATGCIAWDRMITCGVGGGASPDFLFQILGTAGPVAVPAISVEKTVSTDGSCGATNAISAPYGSDVTYCYSVTNTGNVTLTHHTIVDDVLGTIGTTAMPYILVPGGSAFITATYTFPGGDVTNIMTWTAFISGTAISASGTATATVTGIPTDVSLSTVGGQSSGFHGVVMAVVTVALLAGALVIRRRQIN